MGLIRIKKIDDIQLWVYFGLIDLCATKIKYASNGRVRRHASRLSIGRPESFSYAVLGFSDLSEVACTITTCNLFSISRNNRFTGLSPLRRWPHLVVATGRVLLGLIFHALSKQAHNQCGQEQKGVDPRK